MILEFGKTQNEVIWLYDHYVQLSSIVKEYFVDHDVTYT